MFILGNEDLFKIIKITIINYEQLIIRTKTLKSKKLIKKIIELTIQLTGLIHYFLNRIHLGKFPSNQSYNAHQF